MKLSRNGDRGWICPTDQGYESQKVKVTLTLPGNVPVGAEYWKYVPTPDDPTGHRPAASINDHFMLSSF